MDVHPQQIVSLCSGVGWLDEGLRLGLDYFGLDSRVVAYVERESYAASVLLARMVEASLEWVPIADSIDDIDERFCGRVDWIVAGFPCQPWSAAGKQCGTADDRWLWPEIADCIRRVGPRGVMLENVPGVISRHGLEHVLSDLAEMGFDAEWGCLTASAVGASHKRERVFVVAHAGRLGCGCCESVGGQDRRAVAGRAGEAMADAKSGGLGKLRQPPKRDGQPDGSGEVVGDTKGENRRSEQQPSETDWNWRPRLTGDGGGRIFAPGPSADWRDIPEVLWPAIEPGLCELVDGLPLVVDESRADQLRCAGNGCMAIQAAAAFVELVRRLSD